VDNCSHAHEEKEYEVKKQLPRLRRKEEKKHTIPGKLSPGNFHLTQLPITYTATLLIVASDVGLSESSLKLTTSSPPQSHTPKHSIPQFHSRASAPPSPKRKLYSKPRARTTGLLHPIHMSTPPTPTLLSKQKNIRPSGQQSTPISNLQNICCTSRLCSECEVSGSQSGCVRDDSSLMVRRGNFVKIIWRDMRVRGMVM
jgi:hypothetical protein